MCDLKMSDARRQRSNCLPTDSWGIRLDTAEEPLKYFLGGLQQKKNRKKPVPNFKFAVAFGFFRFFSVFFGFFRVFSVFFGFFGFLWYFFGFIRSELRQEIPVIQNSCQ